MEEEQTLRRQNNNRRRSTRQRIIIYNLDPYDDSDNYIGTDESGQNIYIL